MVTKQMDNSAITLILVVVATTLVMPVYLYALNEGLDAYSATNVYIMGLLIGALIMMFSFLMNRRSNLNGHEESDKKDGAGLQSHDPKKSIERVILTLILLGIIGVMVYPVRFYAPDAKALFFPVVYWAGVILGTSLVWIVTGFDSSDKGKEKYKNS